MMGKGEELTPLFAVISLAYVRYCLIFVGHFFVVVILCVCLRLRGNATSGLCQLVNDEAGTELRFKPCCLWRHDFSAVGDVHDLLHGYRI